MGTVSANPPADADSVSEQKARVEAERGDRPFLLYGDRNHRQQLFFFEPGLTAATVGRQSSSDLVVDWDDQVSRLHARFERVQDAWDLVDDGFSRNGTFVNEERLTGRRRLRDGDSLRFGTTTMIFRAPAQHQPNAGPASPIPPASAAPPGVDLSTTQRRVLAALCRPYKGRQGFASPASDEAIAEDLFLSVGEVRAHLRVLYAKLGVEQLLQGDTRVRLVERAFSAGLISERDL
jgi:pSer/pThr/pTyr-binding forkhead associated (FHA) protein/DNA-binding CsgD family transcriptional regulator